jgi:hypothetical protein
MTTPSASPPRTPPASDPGPPPVPPTGGGPVPTPPAGEGTGPPRRSVIALVAAAAVVLLTVALVLVFGLARPPALASLADEPEPDLPAVTWVRWERQACLQVATADTEVREVTCGLRGEEVLGWDEVGIGTLVWERTEAVEVLDPETGEVVEVRSLRGDPWEEREREWSRVDTRNHDGVLTVRLDGTVLWEVEAPESYWLHASAVSPDGRYVVAVDSADRLLLLDATGAREPRVWLEDMDSWQTPVWEGTPIPGANG